MSNHALKWVYSVPVLEACKTLPSANSHRAVVHKLLTRLADFADGEGVCFASIDRLARDCLVNRKTAMEGVRELLDLGLLEKWKRSTPGKRGGRRATGYRLGIYIQSPAAPLSIMRQKGIESPAGDIESPAAGPDPSADPPDLRTRAREQPSKEERAANIARIREVIGGVARARRVER